MTIKKEGEAIPYQRIPKITITYLPNKRGKAEIKALSILKKWPEKENTDVLCGIWHPDAAIAIMAGMKNVYILAHGTELLSGKSKFRKYFWHPIYAKWVLGKAKKVITNSDYTKNLVSSINPYADSIAIPLGVNPEFFKPGQKADNHNILKIGTVSRILQFKGHDFILESLESLSEEYRNKIQWHIAGKGPFLDELKTRVSNSTIDGQVYFHGFVPDKELPQFYNECDLFVLATREQNHSTQVEGFGLVFLEAQSCGIPVIGTSTGGIPDAIESENGGWLISQDNKMQLTDILKRIIIKPSILEKQSILARQRVLQKCSWQNYIANLKQHMQ